MARYVTNAVMDKLIIHYQLFITHYSLLIKKRAIDQLRGGSMAQKKVR